MFVVVIIIILWSSPKSENFLSWKNPTPPPFLFFFSCNAPLGVTRWLHSKSTCVALTPLGRLQVCTKNRHACRFRKHGTNLTIFHQEFPIFPSIPCERQPLSIAGSDHLRINTKKSAKFTMNVQNDSNGQRSNFTHSFMMNSSYSHPSQDDLTDVLDPIDCDLIFECLGHVNSEMGSEYEPMQTTLPTANNGRSARSPTKKSTRIPSSPKEKSSATPRASRPKSISIAMDPSSSSFSYPQNTTATSQEHSSCRSQ